MAGYIPFVHTATDAGLAGKIYSDSALFRLSLATIEKTYDKLPSGFALWIDPSTDIFDNWAQYPKRRDLRDYFRQFDQNGRMGNPEFHKRPDTDTVAEYVFSILDVCNEYAPHWLSVPQLPIVDDSSRNRINRELADATALWRDEQEFKEKLILPAIFTHQRQLNRKTQRNKKIEQIVRCFERAEARGIWVVDSSLTDQSGSTALERTRFPGLVSLHEELLQKLPNDVIMISGPYWGMNMVLWARGLASHVAIGVGSSYQYFLPGTPIMAGKKRIAIPPLRRQAFVNRELEAWIRRSLRGIAKQSPAYIEFEKLAREFSGLTLGDRARRQVAQFYKEWIDSIERVQMQGRPLALYQDLSAAYVLGKTLTDLPAVEKTAKTPERIARQLMLNCL